jgi:hypothetical protein
VRPSAFTSSPQTREMQPHRPISGSRAGSWRPAKGRPRGRPPLQARRRSPAAGLGTGGDGGNVWTLIGTELVQQKQFEAVVLVTIRLEGQASPNGRPAGTCTRIS